jgi:hypothetical protein
MLSVFFALQALALPRPQVAEPSALSVPEAQVQAACTSYVGLTDGDAAGAAWCQSNCALGNCPADTCKCAEGGEAPAVPAAGSTQAAPAVPSVPALPGLPGQQQAAVPAAPVAKVKVDQKGEQGLPFEHALIGYWGAGPYTPFQGEEGPTIADALKQGYNTICISFGDQFTADGDFKLDTDMCPANREMLWKDQYHPCAPDKWNVTKEAGVPADSWRYILSFGGAAGPGPYMAKAASPEEREKIENTFADGFVKRYAEIKKEYGFDGIDIDVESSLSTPLLSAFRKIFKKLHDQGEIISMAPESPSLNPGELEGFEEGSHNSYVPLVDTTIVNDISWVAPQLYNDLIPFGEDPAKYVESLNQGKQLAWDGKTVEVKVPPNKIILGHPATKAAAPARGPPDWQSDPEALLALYKSSPTLMATKGVMTWSIGHDYSNDWKWIKAVKQIWAK